MKKKLSVILLCLTFILPAYAVFNEKNISRTISVLRHELHVARQEKNEQDKRHEKTSQMAEVQHKTMVNTIRWINELTLILYSQEKDFTLDQTYAMEGVMHEFKRFGKRRRPRYMNIETIDTEIERYQRLIESLRLLPPKLGVIKEVPDTLRRFPNEFHGQTESINAFMDSLLAAFSPAPMIKEPVFRDTAEAGPEKNLLKELALYGIESKKEAADTSHTDSFILSPEAQADRDSCIAYAKDIIRSYTRQKDRIREDELYFTEVNARLQQNYDYSKARYDEIQKYIFVTGQESYFYVLSHLKKYLSDAFDDMEQKYGSGDTILDQKELRGSQWRGFGLAGTILYAIWNIILVSLVVLLLFNVILRKFKPFNTDAFRRVRPVVLLLAIAVLYSLIIIISFFFPMSNSMAVASGLTLVYLWLVIALLLSVLISMKAEDAVSGLIAFQPIIIIGLLVMFCRTVFLPDKIIHLLSSPVLLVFFIWQIFAIRKFKSRCKDYKTIDVLMTITAVVFGLALLSGLEGFSLFALMLVMWWMFQIATVATLATVAYLMRYIEKKGLANKKERYAATHKMVSKDQDGDFIRVTWLFDSADRALIPIAGIFSLLGCIWLASGVFNLTETCRSIFHEPFMDFKSTEGNPILQVTLFKLASVCACFFLFRYFNYLARSLYRTTRLEKVMKTSGNDFVRKNDVNLTLGYNVIGIIIWGLFAVYAINILKIPVGALSIVVAGLATGIGLALKDVLNNFIYGIQLMSGRLRVGDIVECDGIRGTVETISYQSTEIETLNGSVISFTNSTLFNKNFQNLTKNTPYEFVGIVVSIAYGEDVARVRELILAAMNDYTKRKDKYGRCLIEKKSGIRITVSELAESSVDLAIKQMVLVESKTAYVAEVKELVYKTFTENGIVIPFPQREVSILNFPEASSISSE